VADQTDERTERLRDRLKWFLFVRVLIVSFFLGALALVYLGEPNHRYAVSVSILLAAIATTYALTIVSAILLLRLKRINRFAYLQLAFDILLTTGVIFVTGGADSPFGSLYSLVVINAAVLMSTPGAIGAAAGTAGLPISARRARPALRLAVRHHERDVLLDRAVGQLVGAPAAPYRAPVGGT